MSAVPTGKRVFLNAIFNSRRGCVSVPHTRMMIGDHNPLILLRIFGNEGAMAKKPEAGFDSVGDKNTGVNQERAIAQHKIMTRTRLSPTVSIRARYRTTVISETPAGQRMGDKSVRVVVRRNKRQMVQIGCQKVPVENESKATFRITRSAA